MKKILILIIILLSSTFISASEIEDKEEKTINKAIDLLYYEKFDEAEGIFKYIKNRYPDHPVGDFFMGFYYNFLASYYETDKFDSKIVLYYNLAEKKARFHLAHDPDDPWYDFYIGSCMVNKGYLMGRDGRRLAGIRKTFDGIDHIEDCLEKDKEFGDAQMLLGSYKYYKSSLIHWVYDRRDIAVFLIKKSIDNSHFSKYLALSTLGWIYIDYEKYELAEKTADKALEKYPDIHLFLFLKARALFEQKKYYEANLVYHKIENKLKNMRKKYSEKDIFNTYYFLTRGYLGQNNLQMADKYLDIASECSLTSKEKDMLEDRIDDLDDIAEDIK